MAANINVTECNTLPVLYNINFSTVISPQLCMATPKNIMPVHLIFRLNYLFDQQHFLYEPQLILV